MLVSAALLGLAGVVAAGVAWYQSRQETPPPPTTPTSPNAAETEPPPCSRLLELVRSQGSAAGEAAFFREIQHAAGRQGFQSGGWMGAIIGGITGAGAGSNRVRECKAELGAAYDEARDAHRATRRAIRDDFKACKDACKAAHPHHGLGPQGKPYRDCVKNCRGVRHDARRAMHGPDNPGSTWLRTFLP